MQMEWKPSSVMACKPTRGNRMRPLTLPLAAALLAVSCAGVPTAPTTPTAAFDKVWETFNTKYPYFELKQIDWPAARDTFRPQAETAADIFALNSILLDMLVPLRDVHVVLESPDGQRSSTYQPTAVRNWTQARWQQAIAGAGWTPVQINLGRARIDGVPYIAIGSWSSTQFSIADVDDALDPFREDSVLIIDVRVNGGGDDDLALAFASRFTDQTVVSETFRFRTGPAPDDLGNPIVRSISPRGPWTFAGRVFVLSGRGVFSSNESFVAAMREMPRVTIVGDTTGGASGNPSPTEYYTGWKVWVSTWFASLPDGSPIEWKGIPPDIFVPWPESGSNDAVIAAAVALAKSPSSGADQRESARR